MAVTFDAVGPAGGAGTAGTGATLSWTHVIGANANAIVVGCSVGPQVGTDINITLSATCGGIPMTSLGIIHTGGGTAGLMYTFLLLAPPTGSQTIVVTRLGGTGTIDLIGGSISAIGVNSAGTPVGIASVGSQASLANVIGSKSGDMIVSFGAAGAAFTGFSQTLDVRDNVNALTGAGNFQGGHATGAAPTVTATHTPTAADFIGAIGINLSTDLAIVEQRPNHRPKRLRRGKFRMKTSPAPETPNPRVLAGPVFGSAITLDSPPFNWDPGALVVVPITATGSVNGQTLASVAATNWTGGAWTIVGVPPPALSEIGAYIAYAVAGPTPQTAPSVFTATFNAASADNQLSVIEFQGQDTVPVDTAASVSAQNSTSTTGPPLTLGAAPNLIDWTFSVYGSRNANPPPVVGTTGFIPLVSLAHTNPTASMLAQYRVNSISLSVDVAGENNVSNSGAAIVINGKTAAAPPPPDPITPQPRPRLRYQQPPRRRLTAVVPFPDAVVVPPPVQSTRRRIPYEVIGSQSRQRTSDFPPAPDTTLLQQQRRRLIQPTTSRRRTGIALPIVTVTPAPPVPNTTRRRVPPPLARRRVSLPVGVGGDVPSVPIPAPRRRLAVLPLVRRRLATALGVPTVPVSQPRRRTGLLQVVRRRPAVIPPVPVVAAAPPVAQPRRRVQPWLGLRRRPALTVDVGAAIVQAAVPIPVQRRLRIPPAQRRRTAYLPPGLSTVVSSVRRRLTQPQSRRRAPQALAPAPVVVAVTPALPQIRRRLIQPPVRRRLPQNVAPTAFIGAATGIVAQFRRRLVPPVQVRRRAAVTLPLVSAVVATMPVPSTRRLRIPTLQVRRRPVAVLTAPVVVPPVPVASVYRRRTVQPTTRRRTPGAVLTPFVAPVPLPVQRRRSVPPQARRRRGIVLPIHQHVPHPPTTRRRMRGWLPVRRRSPQVVIALPPQIALAIPVQRRRQRYFQRPIVRHPQWVPGKGFTDFHDIDWTVGFARTLWASDEPFTYWTTGEAEPKWFTLCMFPPETEWEPGSPRTITTPSEATI